jgi:hypothetical protein
MTPFDGEPTPLAAPPRLQCLHNFIVLWIEG